MDSPCNLCIRVVLPGLLYCFSIFAVSIFFVVPESCVTCLAFVLFFDSSTSLKNALDLFGVEFSENGASLVSYFASYGVFLDIFAP